MTNVIAIANQKGGVGKTTTVINLSVALAQARQKVLAVDIDPQGALTAGLGLYSDKLTHTTYEALMSNTDELAPFVQPIQAFLDLMPTDNRLAAAETELISEIRRELILKRILKPVLGWYDFVLIDCPPSLGLLTINGLCAADEVLIPLQAEFFAMRGLQMLLETVEKVKERLNPELDLAGILPTMYSTGTVHAREVLEEIKNVFGSKVYDVVVYKSIRFSEASVANQAIVEYEENHKGAQAYRELAQILIENKK